jgi:hypothetical protein
MPDITCCSSQVCPIRNTCYRNPASGTKPSEYRQAYFMFDRDSQGYIDGKVETEDCIHYWKR